MSLPLYDPNDEKDQVARRGIQTHQKAIASLDAKIASLLDVVETLRDLRRDHQDHLKKCESVLTLARRLPHEMLGHIFGYCVDAYPSAPLILSQVCAAWRRAALTTPHMWSRIFIDCAVRRSAEKAYHWLHMSGGYIPIYITLIVAHNASLLSVMHALVPHSHRWASLTVDAQLPFHVNQILEIIQDQECTPRNLETVDFIAHEGMEGVMDFRAALDSSKCPRLHNVHFQNSSWHWATFPHQITVLNLVIPTTWISPQTVSHIIDLLRDAPALECFSLMFSDGSFPHGTLEPVGDFAIAMSYLHTLILTGCHSIFEILAHLTVPRLRHLALRETGKEFAQQASIGPSLLRMLEISSPSLSTLELYDIDASDDEFIRCFDDLPALEGLFLHESEISDAVFSRLCSAVSNEELAQSWICPQLSRLDLRWCSQLSGRMLVDLVQARLEAPQTSCISEVVVINCSSVREEEILSLAALTTCHIRNRQGDFCYHRGCCTNNRYRHRFMLRHAAELRKKHGEGRLVL